ncbi:hypothetical protein NKH77_25560 [Streptomyces sp. M19]
MRAARVRRRARARPPRRRRGGLRHRHAPRRRADAPHGPDVSHGDSGAGGTDGAGGAGGAGGASKGPDRPKTTRTALRDGGGIYPRAIRLAHSGDANGRVLASGVVHEGGDGVGAVHESTDDGASFHRVGAVTAAASADGRGCAAPRCTNCRGGSVTCPRARCCGPPPSARTSRTAG